MLERQSVRQRVAFALSVGYGALSLGLGSEADRIRARQALDQAAGWIHGEAVSARELTDHLMNEREEGLLLVSRPSDSASLGNAWNTIETVVGYVAWHAWQHEGAAIDALVSEFDETVLDDICIYAAGAGLDTVRLIQLRQRVESILTPDIPNPTELLTHLQ